MRPKQRRRRFVIAWVLVLALGGCMWWGIHPPRSEHAYRREAASTLQLLRSDVETTQLWLTSHAEDKVTTPATEVALTETETDANARSSSYSSYQPPARDLVEVRSKVLTLADEVVSTLGEIRVDALAGRWDEAVTARTDLERLAGELRDLQREVTP